MVDSTNLSMRVELFIAGRKLKDLDAFSKSDPQCRVFEMINNSWVLRGSTEQIKNNLNPDFTKKITINYFFEKMQKLKFEMIDGDGAGEYDVVGDIETTIGNVMGARA
jgi:Ca2+-dependent lipid-binding protein